MGGANLTLDSVQCRVFRTSPDQPWTYSNLVEYQNQIVQKILHENSAGELIFSELEPVVTMGYRMKDDPRVGTVDSLGRPWILTDRGGLETYHGPGQWVIFWVERLEKIAPVVSEGFACQGSTQGRSVKKALNIFTSLVLKSIREFVPDAYCVLGERAGIWDSTGKLASVGVRVRNGVLTHGISVNVRPSSLSFEQMQVCGLVGVKPTYLHGEMETVLKSLLQVFGR